MSVVNLIIFVVFVLALFAWLFGKSFLQAKRRKQKRRFREPQMQFNNSAAEVEKDEDDQWDVVVLSSKKDESAVEAFETQPVSSVMPEEIVEEAVEPVANEQPEKTKSNPNPIGDIIILGLLAQKDRPYAGYELLQALLTAGLRYGKMGIFHRHEEVSGRGNVLFSLASAAAPGTFELPKMGGFATPGLTLFMEVNKLREPLQAFDLMIDTAKQLVEDLGGEIWDDERKPLSEQKIAQWREQIASQEQRSQSADLFANA